MPTASFYLQKTKQANGVDIILPILQMKKLGLQEFQKPVQDRTARSQQSRVGDPLLPLPGTGALSLARWSSSGLRLPLCGMERARGHSKARDNGVSYNQHPHPHPSHPPPGEALS